MLAKLGPQIQWIESFVTGDKIYCIYIAPNEEIVREHALQGGFPANRVSEVIAAIYDRRCAAVRTPPLQNWPIHLQRHQGERRGNDHDGDHGENVPGVLGGARLGLALGNQVAQQGSAHQPAQMRRIVCRRK